MATKNINRNTKIKAITEKVKENKDNIIAMREDGRTLKEIAKRIGVSTTTIYYLLLEEGIITKRMRTPKNVSPGGRVEKLKPFHQRVSKKLLEQIKYNTQVNNKSEHFVMVKNGKGNRCYKNSAY